ncbi:Fur family transcriptional regulator [Jannaschia ovalis]|uniref:Fur family transcriptional regulator n=1 Tax=Jannaschia ovalis TaxID=3038773 RepID=A0ABY8L7Z1_9RHOB|nr:Fur family transcriptional regulator [Jannaschia sp. GRR-S6-38]WGH77486.1 Fur family transcriptional regulator [Jannaschia sp. GRR-S6-38]
MTPLGFQTHDHSGCIDAALAAAEARCAADGLQLTEGRRRVLEILLREHRALGAYEILEQLRDGDRRPQPPTAYRALDFLTAHGFAHRIERLNAFIACNCPDEPHAPVFLICRACEAVAEAPADGAALAPLAADAGFAVERAVMEAEGLCPACRDPQA